MKNTIFPESDPQLLVVESAASIRMMLMDVLRSLGFKKIVGVSSTKDAWHALELDPIDWIIMPLSANDPINGLHFLKTIRSEASLRRTLVTLFIDPLEESHVLPLAFEEGLFSCAAKSYAKETLHAEFEKLLKIYRNFDGHSALCSAEYVRQLLQDGEENDQRLIFEKKLLAMFPGHAALLMRLAEAEGSLGNLTKAASILNQVELLDQRLKTQCHHIRARFHLSEDDASKAAEENILGVKSVILVDPDSDVLHAVSEMLEKIGVRNIECFDNGLKALERITSLEREPDLILMEWKIPGMNGPALLQRIRNHGFVQVPVLILSSLLRRDEKPLLMELAVDEILEKPFDTQSFFEHIISAIQQNKLPTDFLSLHLRFRRLLEAGNAEEAEGLLKQILEDNRASANQKSMAKAEFSYVRKDYSSACEWAAESLRSGGESLLLLNLLGKSLLKLGDHEKALKCLEKANSLCSINLDRLLTVAELNLKLGRFEEAEGQLNKVEQIDPSLDRLSEMKLVLSLEKGDRKAASTLAGKVQSLPSIASYINSRAVALTRSGQYEAGVILYRRTIDCLRGRWDDYAALVSYNLGLCYARAAEYDKAKVVLNQIDSKFSKDLSRKIHSLLHKIDFAVDSGKKLFLDEQGESIVPSSLPPKSSGANILWDNSYLKKELKASDLACHLIFFARASHDARALKMLDGIPRYAGKAGAGPTAEDSLKKTG